MEFDLVNIGDLFLVPLYFIFFLIVLRYIKKKNPDNFLIQKYLVKGFYAKMIGGLIYALLVFFYWGVGDTLSYFRETIEIRQLMSDGKTNLFQVLFYDYSYFTDTFNLKRSVNESGFMVVKISVLLSYLSFTRFLITTMFFGMLAYTGIFKLFEAFVSLAPKAHRFIAFSLLFFPSICLYGSGVLKDTICIGALGWFYYCMDKLTVKKEFRWQFIFILLASLYLIFVIKIYIIAAFLPCYIFYFIIQKVKEIKSPAFKIAVFPLLLFAMIGGYVLFSDKIDDALGAYSVENIQESMEGLQKSYLTQADDAGSNFELGPIEPTLSGMVKKIPVGIVAALYRPYIWEIRKPITLISAMESLFIVLFTLYVLKKTGIFFFFKTLFTEPTILLFLGFSIIFSGLVGLSTLNFGTLARYRIPAIPFYLMGVLLILLKYLASHPVKKSNPAVKLKVVS